MRGLAQIDYAIGVAVMIVVIAFVLSYVTSYLYSPVSYTKTAELKGVADSMQKVFFESLGFPNNWEDSNNIPLRAGLRMDVNRITVDMKENYSLNRTNEPVDVYIYFDRGCKNRAYNNTVRVFDRFLNETNFQIYNDTRCSDTNYLKEGNIVFPANQTSSDNVFWIYYSNKTQISLRNYSTILYLWDFFGGNSLDNTKWTGTATLSEGKAAISAGNNIQSISQFLYKTIEIRSNISDYEQIGFRDSTGSNLCTLARGGTIFYCNSTKTNTKTETNCGAADEKNHTWRIKWNSTNCVFYKNDTLLTSHTTNIPTTSLYATARANTTQLNVDWVKVLENNTNPNTTYSLATTAVAEQGVPTISYFKFNALSAISYENARRAVGTNNNFNLTFCGYSYGQNVSEYTNVISYRKSILFYNSTGLVSPCVATLLVW